MERVIFGWMALTVVGLAWDQISMLPPRPPTPAEVAAATPAARAEWRRVQAELERRIAAPRPLEFGRVWSTSKARVCGLVDRRDTGVDSMVPFFTLGAGRATHLRDDGVKLFMQGWLACLGDYQVALHPGSQEAGFCATRAAGRLPIAAILCDGDAPKPFRPDPD